MPWGLLGLGAVVWMVSDGMKKAGEGVDAAGNGALKLALVAGGGYLVARKMGALR
jgi:hypothetical protein